MVRYLPSVLYVVCTALSNVFIVHVNTRFLPALSLLICVSAAIVFFNVINISRLRGLYKAFFNNLKFSLLINFFMIGVWMSTFYGLSYIDPFTFTLFYSCIPAVFASFVLMLKHKSIVFGVLNVMLVAVLVLYWLRGCGDDSTSCRHLITGIPIAIVGGVFSYFYRKSSKEYADRTNFSPTAVLAVRSYGIVAGCLLMVVLIVSRGGSDAVFYSGEFSGNAMILMATVTVFSFICPLYLNQKGIQSTGHIMHSCIASLTPFCTWSVSYAAGVLKVYNQHFLVLFMATFASFVIVFVNLYHERRKV